MKKLSFQPCLKVNRVRRLVGGQSFTQSGLFLKTNLILYKMETNMFYSLDHVVLETWGLDYFYLESIQVSLELLFLMPRSNYKTGPKLLHSFLCSFSVPQRKHKMLKIWRDGSVTWWKWGHTPASTLVLYTGIVGRGMELVAGKGTTTVLKVDWCEFQLHPLPCFREREK